MSHNYHQIFLHIIIVVKFRNACIKPEWEQKLYSVMGNLVKECECKSLIINGVEDHIHCLISLKPKISISDLMRVVKAKSSKFINDHHLTLERFEWQPGFAVFSYAKKQLPWVYKYIKNQKQHHQVKTFKLELVEELNQHELPFDDKYACRDLI